MDTYLWLIPMTKDLDRENVAECLAEQALWDPSLM